MPDIGFLLEDAAKRIEEIPAPELQVILRRAPLFVRNAGSIAFDERTEEALRNLRSDLGLTREDAIRYVVREWMEKNIYLPVRELDEESDVDGNA